MDTLREMGRYGLMGLHHAAMACLAGGAMGLCLLVLGGDGQGGGAAADGGLYGPSRTIRLVEMGVVAMLGAVGCLVTGLLYGVLALVESSQRGWMHFKSKIMQQPRAF
jgi:hypothetical protein